MVAESGKKRFLIRGTCEELQKVTGALVQLYAGIGLPEEKICSLRLAFDEAVTNAIVHGHRGDRTRPIRIDCEWKPEAITLTVADQGDGFPAEELPDPTRPGNLLKESGRGLYIISSVMSHVSFNRKGNEIRMTLNIKEGC